MILIAESINAKYVVHAYDLKHNHRSGLVQGKPDQVSMEAK